MSKVDKLLIQGTYVVRTNCGPARGSRGHLHACIESLFTKVSISTCRRAQLWVPRGGACGRGVQHSTHYHRRAEWRGQDGK